MSGSNEAITSIHGFIRPPRLRRGQTIGIVAPSSPQRDDERLWRGIRYFESLGYRVRLGEHLWKRYGYLAGSDDERIDDLNSMIRDPDVRMIIGGRGGYGMTRIIDRVDYRALRRSPKIIVGFSDITALNCAVLRRSGLISFSGAMPGVDFGDEIHPYAEESFWRAVTSSRAAGALPAGEEAHAGLRNGRAKGWLLAGNLTLLAGLCGTPYLPKTAGAMLMVEEIGEEAYRVDRLLSQLWNAGVMHGIAGLCFGAFTDAGPRRVSVEPLPIEEVFDHYVDRAGAPAMRGVAYGHITDKLTLPLGVHARLDATRAIIRLAESGVS